MMGDGSVIGLLLGHDLESQPHRRRQNCLLGAWEGLFFSFLGFSFLFFFFFLFFFPVCCFLCRLSFDFVIEAQSWTVSKCCIMFTRHAIQRSYFGQYDYDYDCAGGLASGLREQCREQLYAFGDGCFCFLLLLSLRSGSLLLMLGNFTSGRQIMGA